MFTIIYAWSSSDDDLKVNDSPYGPVNATMLSAVAAKDNTSATVEVHTMIPIAIFIITIKPLLQTDYMMINR